MIRPWKHLTQLTNLTITKESVMTAPISLNHPTPVEQSLVELTRRADQLNIQVDTLSAQLKIKIDKIISELEKERRQPRKFLPLYDRAKFYQFIHRRLKKFNRTLSRVYLETRQFERVVKNYHSTINSLSKEEIHH